MYSVMITILVSIIVVYLFSKEFSCYMILRCLPASIRKLIAIQYATRNDC